jgi:FAD-dependent urate hydroxylase
VERTVVIGAGPYGLSVAAHLKERGVPTRVVGDAMSAWRENMPRGMFLKSEPEASSLSSPRPGSTLRDYLREIGRKPLGLDEPVPIDLFVDYGLWFQQRCVPELENEHVTSLRRVGSAFELTFASGETLQASSVVVASGHVSYAHVPAELLRVAEGSPTPNGLVSHSSQHRDFDAFVGRRVAVVGAGQSALESAALLHEAGAHVTALVRRNELAWNQQPDTTPVSGPRRLLAPRSGLGRGWRLFVFGRAPAMIRYLPDAKRLELLTGVLGPAGAWWLRDRVDGAVDVQLGCKIASVAAARDATRLSLDSESSGSKSLEVDHVLAATGYRVDLDVLPFLDPGLGAAVDKISGAPRLDASFESSVPGLYFTGLASAATFGPAMRFVHGTRFAARRISAAIARGDRRSRAA